MVTSSRCFVKYGNPDTEHHMILWIVPDLLRVGKIPKRIYCNVDMVLPLKLAFTNLIIREHIAELKSWDGCFNIRLITGGTNYSLHSWGIAVDVNAKDNPIGKEPKLSDGFVSCFTDAGFDWGGWWQRKDGMHFQLRKI